MFEVLNQSDDELLKDCDVQTFRSSGPGGQKADATESAVRLVHLPSGVSVQSQESRSQNENRERALRRFRVRYALEERHALDPERFRVPEALRSYVEAGLRINPRNRLYPFLVKMVLDLMEAHEGRLAPAAEDLGTSTNRVVQFLRGHDGLWQTANELRERHGQHALS